MITDRTINAWKAWLELAIVNDEGTALDDVPVQRRDSEELKTYPGIYLEEASGDRMEIGGIKDGNAWEIAIDTKLVTTPGDEDEESTTQAAHSILRNALSEHVGSELAQPWIAGIHGLTCFDVRSAIPLTGEEDGYRVTTWRTVLVVC